MKCSYGCGAEFVTLADANRHAAAEHKEERAQRRADKAAAKAKPKPKTATRKSRATSSSAVVDTPNPETVGDEVAPSFAHDETAPSVAKPGWRDRLWGRKGDQPAPKPTRERKPKIVRRRVSTAKLLGSGWSLTGMGLVRLGVDEPVGRVMQFQGPAAGAVLEGLTKGTPLDRPLQYLASRADEVEAAKDLFELPLLVFMFQRANDDLRMVLEPMLRAAVQRNFAAMVPIVKKAREDEAKWREAVVELGLGGDDPVGEMLATIFGVGEPAPEREVHVA